jgi:glycosyltransferase involved in cell wall biosynthesis
VAGRKSNPYKGASNMAAEVSVVIPSYNRGHLLEQTIPSYLQSCVGEMIIIDDASTDDTATVIERLQIQDSRIHYIRLPENRKQVYAKNRGIEAAKYPYLYFGDDDSFVTANTINILLSEMKQQQADIVGAKALYMEDSNDVNNVPEFLRCFDIMAKDIYDIVDLANLKFNFTLSTLQATKVPVTHACFLIKRELAQRIMFDENYKFNAYREETDFLIRANLAGASIYYQPQAIQINLPRQMATGGAHTGGKLKWHLACVYNNWYFLQKNYDSIRAKYGLRKSKYAQQWAFLCRGIKKYIMSSLLRSL